MARKLTVTPEELYYLGELSGAKYIDYAYIASMGDIEQNRKKYERTVKLGLAAKKVIKEDFSGNIEIDPEVQKLLSPIFEGDFESEVNICGKDKEICQLIRYHFDEERIIMVALEEENYVISQIEDKQIYKHVREIFSRQITDDEGEQFDDALIEKIIALKNIEIGISAVVRIIFVCENGYYEEDHDGTVKRKTQEQLWRETESVLMWKGMESNGI